MYKVDPTLFEKFKSNLQTKSNNNDPNPLVYITRNRTPITTQRFWEKVRVAATVGTRSSIAVRRPEGNLTGDMIFVAQVESGNAVIRKAQPRINLTDMVWSHVTTLNNVSELSIMFDGYMKMVEGKVESYTTGDLPVVFYVDSDNSLKGWNMNTDVIFTISDTAYNVASVRGLYSEAADLNDGIFVFYTNAEGELWEARVLNDEVTEFTQITLKPDGVTGWEDVWASLTFDYRVVLQLKGYDGNTYSLLSASRPSGFTLNEYLILSDIKVEGKFGLIPPEIISVENTEYPVGNWGKQIKITFNNRVYHVAAIETSRWNLKNVYGDLLYPQEISSDGNNIVYLTFTNFNNIVEPATLECLGCVEMGSPDLPLAPSSTTVLLKNLYPVPSDNEYVTLSNIEIEGVFTDYVAPELYNDEYLELSNISIEGDFIHLTFKEIDNNEYLSLDSITVEGQFYHVNDVPV